MLFNWIAGFVVIATPVVFVILLCYIIFLIRKNGLDLPAIRYGISSFLFALFIYLYEPVLGVLRVLGFSTANLSRADLFMYLFILIAVFFLFSLFFSIKTWRAGNRRLATLLAAFDTLLLLYVVLTWMAWAWVGALL